MREPLFSNLDRLAQERLRFAIESCFRDGLLQGLNATANGFVRFLQIGGNDGKLADPLLKWHSKFPWHGAIVEPVPDYFAKLSELHSDNNRLKLVRAAVSDSAGELRIYFVNPEKIYKYPAWTAGIASSNPQHLVGKGVDALDCISLNIECITPLELIERIGNPTKLDLLCIDVEGHEVPILKSFPFDLIDIKIVMFEAWHLTEPERQDLNLFFMYKNKRMFIIWEDAVIVNADDHVRIGYLENIQSLFEAF